MFHALFAPLAQDVTFLNVFRYITFRSMGALITALVLSVVIGPRFIAWLRRVRCGQYIHEDVAAHAAKAGTPTMGGLLILFALGTSVLLWADLTNKYVWQTLLAAFGFGAVGFWDDITKLRHHKNRGISGRAKMSGQVAVALVCMLFLMADPQYPGSLSIPFLKGVSIQLGWFYLPFGVFLMVAASNAVNLTDGLDGLAIGPTIVACVVFAVFVYVSGHAHFARYLLVDNVPGVGEVTVFCAALAGAGMGFLWFNAYPAQVFMGDVGSLALGGALGHLALLARQELVLAVVGGLFVAETLSVIMQVGYFRWTGGKRLFLMAPLHHHLELKGIPESKIITRFWIISILLGMVALSVLKLR